MLGRIVRIAIVLLVVHALVRFVQPYMHYQQFKDAVKEVALFAKGSPISEIVDRVMEHAATYEIPIERDAVVVTRDAHVTYIKIAYEESIEWLPNYKRPMPFSVSVEGWHAAPPARTGTEVK